MFANLGWEHLLVLLVVGLLVLGPERLPGAIHWSANALRQARDYVRTATGNLREELGPEFDDLREPLRELQKLRAMNPRTALTQHLLDGNAPFSPEPREGPGDMPVSTPTASPHIGEGSSLPRDEAKQPR